MCGEGGCLGSVREDSVWEESLWGQTVCVREVCAGGKRMDEVNRVV